ADECLAELTEIAAAPWEKFVIEVTNSKGDVVGVRMDLGNKVKALEIIAKAHGLLTTQAQVSGPVLKAIIGGALDQVYAVPVADEDGLLWKCLARFARKRSVPGHRLRVRASCGHACLCGRTIGRHAVSDQIERDG